MSYMTLSSQKYPLSTKHSLTTPIFYSFQTFAPIPQHYFSKYWGDQCMGRPPNSNFGGPSPSPPRSPPLGFLWLNNCSPGFFLTHFTLAPKLFFLAVQGSGALLSSNLGAVHKVRHAIFGQF